MYFGNKQIKTTYSKNTKNLLNVPGTRNNFHIKLISIKNQKPMFHQNLNIGLLSLNIIL